MSTDTIPISGSRMVNPRYLGCVWMIGWDFPLPGHGTRRPISYACEAVTKMLCLGGS
jgi:hypothetical protein